MKHQRTKTQHFPSCSQGDSRRSKLLVCRTAYVKEWFPTNFG